MNFFKKLIHKLKLIRDIIFESKPPVKVRDIDLDEINDRDKKIKELSRIQKEQEEKKEQIVCPTCGAKTDKLYKCEKCGKEVCEECGTFCSGSGGEDIQTEKTGYYCDECW